MIDQIIMPDSPEAAKLVTVTGWQSRSGRFYGSDERMARWDGATHVACRICGGLVSKSWTACEACREKMDRDRYFAMPEAEWDGKAMVYSDAKDRFYSSPDDAFDCLEEGETEESLRLVICEPAYARELDSEFFGDDLPGEVELPVEVEIAIDAFNAAVRGVVISWTPGNRRLKAEVAS